MVLLLIGLIKLRLVVKLSLLDLRYWSGLTVLLSLCEGGLGRYWELLSRLVCVGGVRGGLVGSRTSWLTLLLKCAD